MQTIECKPFTTGESSAVRIEERLTEAMIEQKAVAQGLEIDLHLARLKLAQAGLMRFCSWCKSWMNLEGRRIDWNHPEPTAETFPRMSHGMCKDCYDQQKQALTSKEAEL